MIRSCSAADADAIHFIINEAAQAYRGVIPADCWHEPYMTRSALATEIADGVSFWGWDESAGLIGVMGLQKVRDVTLIRHAYVRRAHQGRGIGGALLTMLAEQATLQLLVGTWAAASSATGLRDTSWPRRKKPSAVNSSRARASLSRIATALAP